MTEKIFPIRRTALILTFCGSLLISGNAFAAGGACPTTANYLDVANNSLVTLSSLGITSCYYVAANGSDTNNGTSEATPWLHAPFMPNCSGTCATVQNAMSGTAAAGLGFILRGGDTWHFGNSSASPYTGGFWNFSVSLDPKGTSANPVYLGVDQNWYSGSAWARPILTADNPVCNANTLSSSCLQDTTHYYEQYYVNSCPYQSGGANNILGFAALQYYIIDNFELTGLCESSKGQPFENNVYFSYAQVNGPITFTNDYIHGWTHTQFGGPNGSASCTSSNVCADQFAFSGTQSGPGIATDFLDQVVVDGSDSDPVALGLCQGGMHSVLNSVFLYTSQCVASDLEVFGGNLYAYFYEAGHSNLLEETATWNGTSYAIYDNIFHDLENSGGTGGVGFWPIIPVGADLYFFNNLVYNEGAMELFNVGQNGSDSGTWTMFNNTLDFTSGPNDNIACTTTQTEPLVADNNHFIAQTSVPASSCSSQLTAATNLTMNHSTATSDGYTTSETYVDSPTSSSSPTVGAGTNEGSLNSAFCSALSTAAGSDSTLSDAASACLSDTRYACTYDSTNHTVGCPARSAVARPPSGAWDIGAYQVGGGAAPQPPTNVKATAH